MTDTTEDFSAEDFDDALAEIRQQAREAAAMGDYEKANRLSAEEVEPLEAHYERMGKPAPRRREKATDNVVRLAAAAE